LQRIPQSGDTLAVKNRFLQQAKQGQFTAKRALPMLTRLIRGKAKLFFLADF
jgi:hypothetical protein